MNFYIENSGSQMEVMLDPNEFGQKGMEHVHIATIILHQKGYAYKIEDTIVRRWNLLIANRMREVEELDKRTGEIEHYLKAK